MRALELCAVSSSTCFWKPDLQQTDACEAMVQMRFQSQMCLYWETLSDDHCFVCHNPLFDLTGFKFHIQWLWYISVICRWYRKQTYCCIYILIPNECSQSSNAINPDSYRGIRNYSQALKPSRDTLLQDHWEPFQPAERRTRVEWQEAEKRERHAASAATLLWSEALEGLTSHLESFIQLCIPEYESVCGWGLGVICAIALVVFQCL